MRAAAQTSDGVAYDVIMRRFLVCETDAAGLDSDLRHWAVWHVLRSDPRYSLRSEFLTGPSADLPEDEADGPDADELFASHERTLRELVGLSDDDPSWEAHSYFEESSRSGRRWLAARPPIVKIDEWGRAVTTGSTGALALRYFEGGGDDTLSAVMGYGAILAAPYDFARAFCERRKVGARVTLLQELYPRNRDAIHNREGIREVFRQRADDYQGDERPDQYRDTFRDPGQPVCVTLIVPGRRAGRAHYVNAAPGAPGYYIRPTILTSPATLLESDSVETRREAFANLQTEVWRDVMSGKFQTYVTEHHQFERARHFRGRVQLVHSLCDFVKASTFSPEAQALRSLRGRSIVKDVEHWDHQLIDTEDAKLQERLGFDGSAYRTIARPSRQAIAAAAARSVEKRFNNILDTMTIYGAGLSPEAALAVRQRLTPLSSADTLTFPGE